ncbi:MAG: hypothetical protein LBJ92_02605 [Holosporales bacterium]|jgi:hypothetical protein|nr:hypothetical protein [Holosporales bacterium]
MNNTSILKIESEDKVVLISNNATQELSQLIPRKIMRNISFGIITVPVEGNIKQKCLIETKDTPNITLLKSNKVFAIYSLIKIREDGIHVPTVDYVKDSIERGEGFITFRPILKMFLINFRCIAGNFGKSTWNIEFEEE